MRRRPPSVDPLPLLTSAGAVLFSVMLYQGLSMNRTTPRLPAAEGPHEGVVEGDGAPLRLLLLGESTVAGVGASTHAEALSGNLAAMLAAETGRAVRWRALGQNGVTAEACVERLVPQMDGEGADLVMVALGVNDVVLMRGARKFSSDIRRLVAEVRVRVGPRVPMLFSAVPPMGCFPAFPQPLKSFAHFRSRLLDRGLRAVVRETPHAFHVPLPFKGGRAYFCDDGYHPSPLGYAAWTEFLRPAVRGLLVPYGLLIP
jgi:lysophospholipase L1-like esterase